MARYHGKQGVIRINGTILVGATWDLDKSTDKVEVTSFGDANKTYVQGLPDVKGSLAAFWDNSDTSLLAAAEAAGGATLSLYPSSLVAGAYHYGPAIIDYKISVDVKGAVKLTGSFVANGSWGHAGL
jgi:hypothetical protein